MSKGKYKGLHVNKELLPTWIKEFSGGYFSECEISEITQIKDTQHRCSLVGDGKEVLLDFFFTKDGKTTMLPIGKNREISMELAEFIYDKYQYKNVDNKPRNFSIDMVERDTLEELLDYLSQLPTVTQKNYKRNDTNTSDLWQFTSNIGDKITLIYYDKKKLQIQGKPLYLYNEVTVFLSAFMDFNEVIKTQKEFLDVEISPKNVEQEMKDSLPSSYNILSDNLKKILVGSFALQKFDYPFDDYSPIVFPALKTLEGYLKLILQPFGIVVKKTFGDVFQPSGAKHVLIKKWKDKIGNTATIQAAEQIYAYLQKHRHTLFHTGVVDVDTRIIETRQEANMIVSDVLTLIENSHRDIQATNT